MSLQLALDTATLPHLRPRAPEAKRVCRLLQVTTAAAFGVPVEEVRSRSRRSAEVAFAPERNVSRPHRARPDL